MGKGNVANEILNSFSKLSFPVLRYILEILISSQIVLYVFYDVLTPTIHFQPTKCNNVSVRVLYANERALRAVVIWYPPGYQIIVGYQITVTPPR